MKALLKDYRIKEIEGDVCMAGTDTGKTSFMTNASGIATRSNRQCKRIQKSIKTRSEERTNVEMHADDLCREIVRGLVDTMKRGQTKRDSCGMCFCSRRGRHGERSYVLG